MNDALKQSIHGRISIFERKEFRKTTIKLKYQPRWKRSNKQYLSLHKRLNRGL